MGDTLTLVYRNFPLRQIHKHAEMSARAAEAAALQGKFWEMHHRLFRMQKEWEDRSDAKNIFIGYARDLGLDEAQFVRDLDSPAVAEKIENDLQSGLAAGIKGTPTFFLNGKSIPNPRSYEELKQAVENARAAQGS
jgi:protein-disulfide isomerase